MQRGTQRDMGRGFRTLQRLGEQMHHRRRQDMHPKKAQIVARPQAGYNQLLLRFCRRGFFQNGAYFKQAPAPGHQPTADRTIIGKLAFVGGLDGGHGAVFGGGDFHQLPGASTLMAADVKMIADQEQERIIGRELPGAMDRLTKAAGSGLLYELQLPSMLPRSRGEGLLIPWMHHDADSLHAAVQDLLDDDLKGRFGNAIPVNQGLQRERALVFAGSGDDSFVDSHNAVRLQSVTEWNRGVKCIGINRVAARSACVDRVAPCRYQGVMHPVPFLGRRCLLGGILLACALLIPTSWGGESPAATASVSPRIPRTDADFRYWLQNMITFHGYSVDEVVSATGLSADQVTQAMAAYRISAKSKLPPVESAALRVLPYPGGRHPRIGFLEGAIDPQRETKLSVFAPWDPKSYVVVDVPEAIWSNLGLTYLAHTHVPTIWSRSNVVLPKLEWRRRKDGSYSIERQLPNGIGFATKALPARDALRLEMRLTNGTPSRLTDLRVQMCAMLKGMSGFNALTNANKLFARPFSVCKSEDGQHWVIWAWEPVHRTWGNPPVPCLHSDPKFPDCDPGATKTIRGWLSFYEGTDIQSELKRIEQDSWLMEAATGVK